MKMLKLLFKRKRTVEDELKLTAFTMFFCLFVVLPLGVVLAVIL